MADKKLEWWRDNFKKFGSKLRIFSFARIGKIYFTTVFAIFFHLILLVVGFIALLFWVD